MQSEIVQFREDRKVIALLRKKGMKPNEMAREAFRAMLRRLQAEESMEELSRVKARLPKPIAQIIREERESP